MRQRPVQSVQGQRVGRELGQIRPWPAEKKGELENICQIEPVSQFKRILEIPFCECTVDVV
jgi:hypothetical protein